jgi:hypothetical protein
LDGIYPQDVLLTIFPAIGRKILPASICDYELIAVLIKPVVEIYQKEIAKVQKEDNANHAEYMDWLKCEIGGMLAEIENDERYKEKQSGFDQAHGEVVAYKRVLKLMGEKIDVD